jgi:hypothetical protein
MDDLKAVKRRVSAALIDQPGVSGVGLRGGNVVVYVEREARRGAGGRGGGHGAPGVALQFEITGTLKAQ